MLIQLRGRADLVLEDAGDDEWFVDVKSGRWDPRDALIQLGIYVLAGRAEGRSVSGATAIHAPRGADNWQAGTRLAGDLAAEATRHIRYIAEIARTPGGVLAVPGQHCERCENVDCFFHKERDNDEITW